MRPASQPPSLPVPAESVTIDQLETIAAAAQTGVTIICGFPASGKSSTARLLAELTDAVIFDKDGFAPSLEESVMAELTGDPYDRDSSTYHRIVNSHIYSALVGQALTTAQRTPVILDAPFLGHVRAAAAQGISLSVHIASSAVGSIPPIRAVWVSATAEQIRQRMTFRGAPRDAGKLASWNTYRSDVLERGTAEQAAAVVDYVVRT